MCYLLMFIFLQKTSSVTHDPWYEVYQQFLFIDQVEFVFSLCNFIFSMLCLNIRQA